MPQGVIFDMDGVVVASGPAHAASWRMLARKHGKDVTDELFAKTFGQTSRDIVRAVWGDGLGDAEVRVLDDEKERIYRELITGLVPVTVGARELVVALHKAGFTLAIGTSGPPENVELVLRETKLGRYFTATVNGHDVAHGKPSPDIYLKSAEQAGLRPAECVVVEDAPVGIEAGKAAGMKVIALVGTHPAERLRQTAVDVVVAKLGDITPELIRGLLRADGSLEAAAGEGDAVPTEPPAYPIPIQGPERT